MNEVRPGAGVAHRLPVTGAPRACWYAVATGDEVGPALLSRRALDTSLVLWRRRSGEIAVLADHCAHRQLPLSIGRIVDDQVVCAYHGFTYAWTGACVLVPSQERVPYGAAVRSFPVREVGPYVWVWLGPPGRPPQGEPPSLPVLTAAGWRVIGGSFTVACNYLLLHENALDRTHFAFVHPETSHRGYLTEPPPVQVEVTETSVSYARTFPPAPPAAWQAAATGLTADQLCVQRESGVFVTPALHVDDMDIEGPDGAHFRTSFIRAFTPMDERSTLVLWHVARDFGMADPAADRSLRRLHEQTMAEDQPLLEAIQADIDRYGMRPVTHAAADVASVRAQQIVARLLHEERPTQA